MISPAGWQRELGGSGAPGGETAWQPTCVYA